MLIKIINLNSRYWPVFILLFYLVLDVNSCFAQIYSDFTMCSRALDGNRTNFNSENSIFKNDVKDAKRLGYTVEFCRKIIGLDIANEIVVSDQPNPIKIIRSCGQSETVPEFKPFSASFSGIFKNNNYSYENQFLFNGTKKQIERQSLSLDKNNKITWHQYSVIEGYGPYDRTFKTTLKPGQKSIHFPDNSADRKCSIDIEFENPPIPLKEVIINTQSQKNSSQNQEENLENDMPNFTICKKALNESLDNWSNEIFFIVEAKKRNLSIAFCKMIVTDKNQFIPDEKIALQIISIESKINGYQEYYKNLCRRSLSLDRMSWYEKYDNIIYVKQAKDIGLSVDYCRQLIGLKTLAQMKLDEETKKQSEAKLAEQKKQDLEKQRLLDNLTEFLNDNRPSGDLVKFSIAASNFRDSFSKSENEKSDEAYRVLTDILSTDTNYQKFISEKVLKAESEKSKQLNEKIELLKNISEFIYFVIKKDPLNERVNSIGEHYLRIRDYLEKSDTSNIDDFSKWSIAFINQQGLSKDFDGFLKSVKSELIGNQSKTEDTDHILNFDQGKFSEKTAVKNESFSTSSNLSFSKADSLKKVALIIGNSNYKNVAKLDNPKRDIELIAKTLKSIGFSYIDVKNDLSQDDMNKALRDFSVLADQSDWSVIYFAGHGIEFGGNNYLIPIDAKLKSDRDIELETIDLNKLLRSIEGAKKLKLVLLDACRDNPFSSQMKRTIASRSIGRGLASIEPEPGILVIYAAKNGEIAFDGDGSNSPFATAIANRLTQKPALEIRRLVDFVRDDVLEFTRGKQQPFSYGSLPAKEDFFFAN